MLSENKLERKIQVYSGLSLLEVIIGELLILIGWNVKAEDIKYALFGVGSLILIASFVTLFVFVNRMLCALYPYGRIV